MALPLRAFLYVRQLNAGQDSFPSPRLGKFATKFVLAARLSGMLALAID